MDSISIRYGTDVTLTIDAGDVSVVAADLYVGKPGELYKFTAHADLTYGVGAFEIPGSDTQIPLDTYYYQINLTNQDGSIEKLPSPEIGCSDCENEDGFPEFVVGEALDSMEIS